jgi:hypothetical protein
MSTAVTLWVTPSTPVDPHGHHSLPSDLASLLAAAGQTWEGALSRSGDGPWRLNLQIRGRDRFDLGRQLESDVRGLGYEADLHLG